MNAESSEKGKPKSPWSKVADSERQLGPKETQRIRGEREKAEDEKEEGGKWKDSPSPEGIVKAFNDFQLEQFRIELMKRLDVGQSITKSYSIASNGYLQVDDLNTPANLLHCVPSPKVEERNVPTPAGSGPRYVSTIFYTPDDLRTAAQRVMEKFPYIVFTFEESHSRDRISYTVTLKASTE